MLGITAEGGNASLVSAGRLWMHRAGIGDAAALGKVFEDHTPAGIRGSQHQLCSLCLAFLENGSGSRARAQTIGVLLEKAPK